MSRHMFRVYIGLGSMSVSDLEDRINTWVSNNGAWSNDSFEHILMERNTELDGSGTEYYQINIRFHKDDAKDNILQKFEDKLKKKVSWYRVGYHECIGHDSNIDHHCSWQSDGGAEWTAKGVDIPIEVESFDE